MMKPVSESTICVCDHGYYVALAERLARDFKKVYYTSPCDREFQCAADCVFGDGLEKVVRTDSMLDPEVFNEIDAFVFPEIGFAPLQKHLRELGIPVWGSFDATYLEMYRTQFLDFVKDIGLPVAPSVQLKGLTALTDHLRPLKDRWVKFDRVRGDCETFHWIDWDHSQGKLNSLATTWGGVKEKIGCVVQEPIEAIAEIGYDGWTVDGKYPESSYFGFEGKNEIYLGALRKYQQLPKQIRDVNAKIAAPLADLGYRNFMASELRVTKDSFFFIDPTFRLPGQTGEQLYETCSNLSDVILKGAHGIMVEPKWLYKFAASATIHYTDHCESEWKVIRVPESVKQWVKPAHYCMVDGLHWFPPSPSDELGVVVAAGNSIPEVFARLNKTIDALKDEPISFQTDEFFDLLDDIREAQKKGMRFSDSPIPTKEQILKYVIP